MNNSDKVIPLNNSGALLSRNEQVYYERKALKGDRDAAFRLYIFYNDGLNDEKSSLPWLRMAANEGHPIAQHDLGSILSESSSEKDRKEGEELLKKYEDSQKQGGSNNK